MKLIFGIESLAFILIWQALLFAALFGGIYFKTKHYPKKFIALYMLANAVYFLVAWLYYFNHIPLLMIVAPISMPLLLSFFPLFYYYFRSLVTKTYRVEGRQWFHLAPSAIVLVLFVPFYLLPHDDCVRYLSNQKVTGEHTWIYYYLIWLNRILFYGLFSLQFIFYVMKFRTNLKLYRLRLELMFSYKENLDLRWMRYLFFGILLFFMGNDLTFFFRTSHPWFTQVFYFSGMIAINFFIGYHSLLQNEWIENEIIARMTHYCALHRAMTQPRFENQEHLIAQELQKYQRSALKEDAKEMILQQLDKFMSEEELFTDPEINIEDLAMKLGTNARYLSQAINEVHQKNFFNYINDLRISKAKTMLNSGELNNLSIEGIARMVGFQSKSSFYTAFKKSTGNTPTEYKASIKG